MVSGIAWVVLVGVKAWAVCTYIWVVAELVREVYKTVAEQGDQCSRAISEATDHTWC